MKTKGDTETKVYIVGGDRMLARAIATEVRAHGIKVISRWHDDNNPNTPRTSVENAEREIKDIKACSVFLNIAYGSTDELSRNHISFATGYAMALGKRIINIGPSNNFFLKLDCVVDCDRLDVVMAHILPVTPY